MQSSWQVLTNVPTGHHPRVIQRGIPFANMLSPVPRCRSDSQFGTIFSTHVYFTIGGNYRPIIANTTPVSSYYRDDDTNLGSEDTEDTCRTKRGIE